MDDGLAGRVRLDSQLARGEVGKARKWYPVAVEFELSDDSDRLGDSDSLLRANDC